MISAELGWVACGGALGALARHGVVSACRPLGESGAVWATFAVNMTGCLALGLIAGWLWGRESEPGARAQRLLLGTGFLGAFTTFSAFGLDTVLLVERGRWVVALGNALAQVALGGALAWVGLLLSRRAG